MASFDVATGLGSLAAGDQAFSFHCTEIADGSRYLAVGQPVRFSVAAAQAGTWEARHIEAQLAAGQFACPVCGNLVAGDPRQYEVCNACGWEDDPVQFDDPSYDGGANVITLADARLRQNVAAAVIGNGERRI